jgi:RNA polymerase sigma-70 factor (ECF subfamily)
MRTADQDHGEKLERFREYLRLLARLQIRTRLRAKIDVSDLVQDTFVDALKDWDQFQGQSEEELAGWLRKILAHNLADAARALGRAKRDVELERSLEAALDSSSCRLGEFLAADQSSPSQRAARHEDVLRLAQALARLPDDQRTAVEMHHLEGATLAETAEGMGCSEPAVAGLLHRGLRKLRELMRD